MPYSRPLTTIVALVLSAVSVASAQTAPPPPAQVSSETQGPITVDGANGLILQALGRPSPGLSVTDVYLAPATAKPPLASDLSRLRQAGAHTVVFTVHPPSVRGGSSALVRGLEQIDFAQRVVAAQPDALTVLRSADDAVNARRQGKLAVGLALADARALEGSLGSLRLIQQLGVLSTTLNGVGIFELGPDGGLSPLGQTALVEANRAGILVDLAGLRPKTTSEVLAASNAPLVWTGAGLRSICDSEWNASDIDLDRLKANDGVLLIPLSGLVLSSTVRSHAHAEWEAFRGLWEKHPNEPAKVRAGLDAWRKNHPTPKATLADVVAHFKAARDRIGAAHLGLASGWDAMPEGPIGTFMPEGPIGAVSGAPKMPEGPIGMIATEWARGGSRRYSVEGFEDAGRLPALWAALEAAGFTSRELSGIRGDNYLRALRAAQQTATRLRQHRQPAESNRSPAPTR